MSRVDVFTTEHDTPIGTSPVRRRTYIGGLAATVGALVAAALLAALCASFFANNGRVREHAGITTIGKDGGMRGQGNGPRWRTAGTSARTRSSVMPFLIRDPLY